MGVTMEDGVETKRRWYRIHADRVPERLLSRYRLDCMMDHEAGGIKAGEKLERAQDDLQASVIAYLEAGGSEELVMRWVSACFKWFRSKE